MLRFRVRCSCIVFALLQFFAILSRSCVFATMARPDCSGSGWDANQMTAGRPPF